MNLIDSEDQKNSFNKDHNYGKANLANKKEQNEENSQFECEWCNYKTNKKFDYDRHLTTNKHKKQVKVKKHEQYQNKPYECDKCNRRYLHISSLSKHRKTCDEDKSEFMNKLFIKVIEQNTEVISKLSNNSSDVQDVLKEVIKNGMLNQTHNNSHNSISNSNNISNSNINSNNTFNLQVYLNETCKDAMNLSEFVNQIFPTLEELEKTAREGYANGC